MFLRTLFLLLLLCPLTNGAAAAPRKSLPKAASAASKPKPAPKNHPPTFKAGLAYQSLEREVFSVDLSQFAEDKDEADSLQFSLKSADSWVRLSEKGVLTAKPAFGDVGKHSLVFTVSDSKQQTAAKILLTVERNPRPPVWEKSPATFSLKTREPFKASVSKYAKDLDGLPLHFTKKSGPAWIQVTGAGEISGTPQDSDAGKGEVTLTAANDKQGAESTFYFEIQKKNYPPVVVKPFQAIVKERATSTWELGNGSWITDPDKEVLTFSLSKAPSWVSISAEGTLVARPLFAQIGKHTFAIAAKDSQGSTEIPASLVVERDPRAPVWEEISETFKTKTREPFKASILRLARDPDKLPLRFSKVKGPEWLTVSPNGELNGTPADTDKGRHSITIAASNDKLGSNGTFSLDVEKKNYPPQIVQPFVAKIKEREKITLNLNSPKTVTDPDREDLRFEIPNSPNWIKLSDDGELTATPLFAQIGEHHFTIQVSDKEKSAALPVTLQVERNPRPPIWKEQDDPFSAKTREAFKKSVASFAQDPDGLPLVFSKISGPLWASVSEKGEISGTPADADKGKSSLTISASNGQASAKNSFSILLEKKNYPPQILKPFEPSIKERETGKFKLSKTGSILDPNQEELEFSLADAPEWIRLSSQGELLATPQFSQIGKHSFQVRVKDREVEVSLPVHLTVVRNPRPPVWQEAAEPFSGKTRELFKVSIASFAKDLDGLPIRFSKVQGPAWLSVSENGELSGTPQDVDKGKVSVIISAANDRASAPTTFVVRLEKKNYPPVVAKPLEVAVKERDTSKFNLATSGNIVDPDREELEFEAVSAPDWVTLTPEGKLEATPLFAHIGTHTFSVIAKDKEAQAKLSVTLKVERNPRPPVWTEQSEPFSGKTREAFKDSLAQFAKDLDGLPLRFSKVSGPEWVHVGEKGEIFGTPADTDKGKASVLVSASNDRASASQAIRLHFTRQNYPLKVVKAFEATIKERDTTDFSLTKTGNVVDPDEDEITFTPLKAPTWITLSPSGKLVCKPSFADIGEHRFRIGARDSEVGVEFDATVKVDRNPRPPVWAVPERKMTFKAREVVKASVASLAKDLDGLALTFSKKSGPDWMQVAPNGALSGTPADAHVGRQALVLQVKNDVLAAEFEFQVEVLFKNHPPVWKQNYVQAGVARAGEHFSRSIASLAADPDTKDSLHFEKVAGPAWAVVAANGVIFGKPGKRDRGKQEVRVRAVDQGREIAETNAVIDVQGEIPKPTPKQKLLVLPKSYQNELFTFNLNKILNDTDFKYSKVSGPPWMKVFPSGEVEGIPAQLGEFDFAVEISNGRDRVTLPGKGQVLPP